MTKMNKFKWFATFAFLGFQPIFANQIHDINTLQNIVHQPIDFCGEKVPLHIADVSERYDRELVVNANMHSATTLIIKRAHKYFPYIETILKQNNIPDDFKYLCVIESALTHATSPAGAKGFWQFMPTTAKEYGLEVSATVDERLDIEKATLAACKYLKNAYDKFGNWTLVAAAYNRGMGGISRDLADQKVQSYYDLYLNEETSRYVFRILALKEIMKNPDKFGFRFPIDQLYTNTPTKIIDVNESIIDLSQWALEQGANYKLLKYFNPWLVDKSLNVSNGKTYQIKLPKTDMRAK